MAWAVTLARGEYAWKAEGSDDWQGKIQRFFDGLAAVDRELATSPFVGSIEKLMQGPLADALTHVGQLAMLRGITGAPVRREVTRAPRLSRAASASTRPRLGREFDGEASAR